MNIGSILKRLRTQKGYSLREFAQKCDLSPSLISQVERDAVSPSINSLVKMAEALNCSISSFFEEQVSTHYLIRKEERRKLTLPTSRTLYELATPTEQDNSLRILVVTLQPGEHSSESHIHHNDREICFVLEGEIEAEFLDNTYILHQGDTLTYEAKNPHNFYNPAGGNPATFILIVYRSSF